MFYDRNLEFKHKETTQSNDMPAKILKSKDNIFAPHICDIFNRCINASQFSSILKPTDTNLVLKMGLFIEKFLQYTSVASKCVSMSRSFFSICLKSEKVPSAMARFAYELTKKHLTAFSTY